MLTLKFFHVLFVFIWIGSLLMLTRLLGYQVKERPEIQLAIHRISRRIYTFIDFPSMLLAVSFGVALLFIKEIDWKAPWLHIKLTFAFCLILSDLICGYLILRKGQNFRQRRGVGYQIFHGLTGIFLIIVLVAIYIVKNL